MNRPLTGKIRRNILAALALVTLIAIPLGLLAVPWRGMSYMEMWREARSGRIVHHGNRAHKLIALTFDDGPDRRYTPAVLDILRNRRIHATFFMCGDQVDRAPDLAKRIVADGHAIGNHTTTHPHLERYSAAEIRREMDQCSNRIERVVGIRPSFFRPPRGIVNSSIFARALERNYKIILWSLAFDRESETNTRRLRDRVNRLAKNGDIILMHDGSTSPTINRNPTVRELDGLIEDLTARGFRFVTVPEMLAIRGE